MVDLANIAPWPGAQVNAEPAICIQCAHHYIPPHRDHYHGCTARKRMVMDWVKGKLVWPLRIRLGHLPRCDSINTDGHCPDFMSKETPNG